MERNHFNVMSVKSLAVMLVLSPHIKESIQERNHCDMMSVRSVSVNLAITTSIYDYTQEKKTSNVLSVKTFSDNSSFAHIKNIHTGEKIFPCDVLSMSFTHSQLLKLHKRTHTQEVPSSI